jgi:hypothetical protein
LLFCVKCNTYKTATAIKAKTETTNDEPFILFYKFNFAFNRAKIIFSQ